MDANTLNAWTRFALQKGGIGACTALIDNPATEPEDLMFMSGEKIIVLRRLDDDGADANERPTSMGARRKSSASSTAQDSTSWYLGYCEGVVGRFKGTHVQFHGRLKKPVLMRRSGASSIPDTTPSGSSKHEETPLPALLARTGITVTTPDSDNEESHDTLQGPSPSKPVASSSQPHARGWSASSPSGTRPTEQLRLATRAGGYGGVNTPPLSDEGHQLKVGPHRTANDDEDSDDSASVLPWARHSRGSSAASIPKGAASSLQHTVTNGYSISSGSSSSNGKGTRAAGAQDARLRLRNLASSSGGQHNHHLPLSPISSNESPITHAPVGLSSSVHSSADPKAVSSQDDQRDSRTSSSCTTSATDDSDDEVGSNRRRDYAFSIYDVYGRDSVAFPNFDFRETYAAAGGNKKRMSRLAASKSSESLAAQANTEPLPPSPHLAGHRSASPNIEPVTPRDARAPMQLRIPPTSDSMIPTALRPALGRRPSAAPDPRLPGSGLGPQNLASSLRRQVEATNSPTSISSPGGQFSDQPRGHPAGSPPMGHNGASGHASASGSAAPRFGPSAFDPRRRPSAANAAAPSMSSRGGPPISMSDSGRDQYFPSSHQVTSPISPASELSSASLRRPGFAESRERRRSQSLSKMQIYPADNSATSSSEASPGGSASHERNLNSPGLLRHGPAGSPGLGPVRASSDRLSERERINSGSGSGMLRKNPSNPTPGLYGGGGMPGLSPMARSTSPMGALSAPSPVEGIAGGRRGSDARSANSAPRSPNSAPRSPMRSPMASDGLRTPTYPVPPTGPASFDAMGFVNAGGPPIAPQLDDPETREKWMALFKEDDAASAKKSRKVKKLVRQGIPPSVRGQAWLFLANASVRRRAGLFEQLCKTSQGAKGKKGKETLYEAIDKDLDRSFPDHKLFMGEAATGKADLEAILKSYVHFNPVIGYTQGMGLLAGLALIHMAPEDAFWLLCAALRDPHMEGYYTPTMKQLHVDSVVLGQLLATMDPELQQRLEEHGIEPIMFTPSWFLPLFTRIVPWTTLIRVWDIFFWEGPTWLLRVALAVIRIIREPLMRAPGHGEMLQMLLHPPQAQLTPDNVLNCAFSVKLKDGEMRKLSRQASTLVRESQLGGKGRGRTTARPDMAASRSISAPARR